MAKTKQEEKIPKGWMKNCLARVKGKFTSGTKNSASGHGVMAGWVMEKPYKDPFADEKIANKKIPKKRE